jgi:hypothetical protein
MLPTPGLDTESVVKYPTKYHTQEAGHHVTKVSKDEARLCNITDVSSYRASKRRASVSIHTDKEILARKHTLGVTILAHPLYFDYLKT